MKDDNKKEQHIINVFIKVSSLLTAVLGILAILGWIFDIHQLASFDSSKIPMALSTAVLFAAYGLIIFFHNRLPLSRIVSRVGIAFSSVGISIALLLLYLSLKGISSNAEHLWMKISGGADGLVVGHMSPITAFIFVLIGLSFLLMQMKAGRKKQIRVSFISAVLVIFISIILLLSYLFGTPLFYEGSFIPPALTTSLSFLFLGIALLFISGLEIWSYEELSDTLSTRFTSILFLVLIVLVVSIITAGYSYYKVYEKINRTEIEQQLSSIASLKVNQIVQWRKERLGDAEFFYKNSEFSEQVKRYINNQNDSDAKERIQAWIRLVHLASSYNRISLHNMKGVELIIFHGEKIPNQFVFSVSTSEALESGQIIFQDFYRDKYDKRIYLTILIPIFSEQFVKNVIGILALRIAPEQYLYPLINEWPTPSKTAETLLVRRDGNETVFLNELRFQKNTALDLKRLLTEFNLPAARAALGKKEIMDGVDYRGERVIAYVCPIPDSPWFLVTRMDSSEVYAPITEKFWFLVFFVIVLLLGTSATIGMVWRHQRVKFYKEREESLRESEDRYRDLVENSSDLICTHDLEGNILSVNNAALKITGYTQEEAIKMNMQNIIAPEYRRLFNAYLAKIKTIGNANGLMIIQTKTGERRIWEYNNTLRTQGIAKPIVRGMVKDITERKKAETALRENESKLRNIFEHSTNLFYSHDTNHVIHYISPQVKNILGYEVEEACIKWTEFASDNPINEIGFQKTVQAIETGKAQDPYELELIHKNGNRVRVEVRETPVVEDGKTISIVGSLTDITERKRAEEEIISQKNKFAQLFDNSPIAIALLDDQDKIVHINESFTILFGYSLEEIKGVLINDLIVPPEFKEEASTLSNETQGGNQINKESYRKKKDGSNIFVQIVGVPIAMNNRTIGIYGMYVDLTQRKDAEEKMKIAKELAEHSNKLKSEFLAQMSHEIRSPMHSVLSFANLLRSDLGKDLTPDYLEYLDGIDSAGHRLVRTVELILNASEMQVGTYEPTFIKLDLINDVFEKIKNNYKKLIDKKGLVLNIFSNISEAVVVGDEYSIYQMFANLIDNAIKYTTNGSISVTISTAEQEQEQGIKVTIEDTGIGMSEEFMSRMFQPFTQEDRGYSRRFDGNGLGLALVKKYCDLNRIAITVESTKGKGSKFTLIFTDTKASGSDGYLN